MDWDEFAEGWDEMASGYADAALASLQDVLGEHGRALTNMRVLDFGCGTGLLTEKIAPLCEAVVALDISKEMVRVLEGKIGALPLPNVYATSASLDSARDTKPFAEPFDLIVCSSVCAFVDDYPGLVASLTRLLAAEGMFIQWDWERDDAADEPFGFTRAQIAEKLGGAGLHNITVKHAFEISHDGQTMKPLVGYGFRSDA